MRKEQGLWSLICVVFKGGKGIHVPLSYRTKQTVQTSWWGKNKFLTIMLLLLLPAYCIVLYFCVDQL